MMSVTMLTDSFLKLISVITEELGAFIIWASAEVVSPFRSGQAAWAMVIFCSEPSFHLYSCCAEM